MSLKLDLPQTQALATSLKFEKTDEYWSSGLRRRKQREFLLKKQQQQQQKTIIPKEDKTVESGLYHH
jgi:hypothetical protein